MSEIWKTVIGYEGYYEVSSQGRVRSLDRTILRNDGLEKRWKGQIIKSPPNGHGRPHVSLRRDGGCRSFHVHTLVLAAFVGPCPEGLEVCHNDGDRTNNWLTNLRYDTHSANILDAVQQGTHVSGRGKRRTTHCPRGHEWDRLYGNSQHCSICDRERSRARRPVLTSV